MILGTGIDIVETARIRQSLERFGDRFLNRIFLPGEIEYCQQMKYPHLHLAARFAAKEAISKAFGTGIGEKLGWKDMEICRRVSGEPFAMLLGKGQILLEERKAHIVHVSLSHTDQYAAAMAVLEG